jgi:hypothetical protein
MKTILFKDRASGAWYKYDKPEMKRNDRILSALQELKNVGNVVIYLQNGNKQRKLFVKSL